MNDPSGLLLDESAHHDALLHFAGGTGRVMACGVATGVFTGVTKNVTCPKCKGLMTSEGRTMADPPVVTPRRVKVHTGMYEIEIGVTPDATGHEIKQRAIDEGLPIELSWQLQGHNCNGSNLVIGNTDRPWHDQFSVVAIYDNA